MKTNAICTTPEEFREKLILHYESLAKQERGLEAAHSAKRDCDRYAASAGFYERQAGFLRGIEIWESVEAANGAFGFYL